MGGLLALQIASGIDSFAPEELLAILTVISDLAFEAVTAVSELLVYVPETIVVDLVAMYGVALRRSGPGAAGLTEDARTGYRKLRHTLAYHVGKALETTFTPDESMRQVLLFRLLMRTQVLRCYGSLLSGAAQQLKERPSRRNVEFAAELLTEVVDDLLWPLATTPDLVDWNALNAGPGPGAPTTSTTTTWDSSAARFTKQDFVDQLAGEMLVSSLLDAWSTCFLQLVGCGEWSDSEAARLLNRFAHAATQLNKWLYSTSLQVRPFAEPAPALLYLLAAHAVRLLAMLDGGPCYGMPPQAPELPLSNPAGAIIRRRNCGEELDGHLLDKALSWWGYFLKLHSPPPAPGAAAFPPYNRAATLEICVRVLEVVAATSRGTLAAGPPQQQQPQQPRRRAGPVLLSRRECGRLAAKALRAGVEALGALLADRGDPDRLRDGDEQRLRALWAAYMRVVDAAMDGTAAGAAAPVEARGGCFPPVAFGGSWSTFRILPVVALVRPGAGGLPARPGPLAAAALSAGALARVERLTRLGIRDALSMFGAATWTELLLFGPPGELAALIASVAKRVRGCAARLEQLTAALTTTTPTGALSALRGELLGAQVDLSTEIQHAAVLLDVAFKAGTQAKVAAALAGRAGAPAPGGGGGGGGDGGWDEGERTAERLTALLSDGGGGSGGGSGGDFGDWEILSSISGDGSGNGSSDGGTAAVNGGDGDDNAGNGGGGEAAVAGAAAGGGGGGEAAGEAGGGGGGGVGGHHEADGGGNGGNGDDDRSHVISGARQFVALSSFAAARLLPAVAGAVRHLATSAVAAAAPASASASAVQSTARHRAPPPPPSPPSHPPPPLSPGLCTALEATLNCCLTLLTRSELRALSSHNAHGDLPAARALAAAQFRDLLLVQVDVVGLLAAVAALLASNSTTPARAVHAGACGAALGATLQMACIALPQALRQALRRASPTAAAAGAPGGSSSGVVRGPGPGQGRAAGGAAALDGAALAAVLGPRGLYPHAGAMAWVDAWEAAEGEVDTVCRLMDSDAVYKEGLGQSLRRTEMAQLLLPPEESWRQAAPHCCANACCTNLAGPSERALLQLPQ
ncbi:hypothetical protein PLESTB_000376200 [Pleodorina starrii]|uniref:Uncharacterized protein n=1 Tax=Pleodorina starrii TaxID=330485 RepID=A0A9W6BE07_9CHLO|nr:hypothetical protein PLESTB_000376200 [Pleodorina starrii]GLC64210.1 hypothetical protein PLESTF_000136500 [Pleodorina starrii]